MIFPPLRRCKGKNIFSVVFSEDPIRDAEVLASFCNLSKLAVGSDWVAASGQRQLMVP